MFPGVYGFQWNVGYLMFLGIFYAVLLAIGATVALAIRRAIRAYRARQVEALRWKADFEDLAAHDRACRHDIDGKTPGRVCQNGFDCRACAKHAEVAKDEAAAPAVAAEVMAGVPVPLDRMYHRGHTWVRPEPDGTVLVGLDEFARRLTGRPDWIELPQPGTQVEANGTAWRMARNGFSARVLSPVDGTVVETRGPGFEWYLKVNPSSTECEHLLKGDEVRPWMLREAGRVGAMLGVAAADGGVLVEDAVAALPEADWDAVWGGLFLEP